MPKTIKTLILWHGVSLAVSSALHVFYLLAGSERHNIYTLIAFYLFGAAMFPSLHAGVGRLRAFLITMALSFVVAGCIWVLFQI